MNRARVSIASVWVAFFVAACSGSSPSTTGQTSQPGASGGGSAAQTVGSPAGTAAGTSAGNTGGTNAGNTGGTGAGNTAGTNAGNTGGTNAGNTGGTNAGTAGVSPTGGTSTASTSTAPTLITSAQGTSSQDVSKCWQTGTVTTVTSGTADVTVNDSSTSQTWEGFGGCFNEMGWNQLTTTALQTQAINLLFGSNGAHFVLGRIPIGASDYAMNRYTLDDASAPPNNDPVPNTGGTNRPAADTSLTSFSITRDTEKLIPYIQAALAVNPNLRLWASPWTPPVWMKTGYKTNSGAPAGGNAVRPSYFDGGNMKSDTTTLNAYAQYLVKWLQAYQVQGITVETVSAQNEPGYDQNYPSCLWDSATYTSFVKILGPALSSAGLSTNIMGGTMSNPNDSTILSTLMGDTTAKSYIGVIGVQWGMLDNASSSPSTYSAYGKPLWATEHKCGNYPWNPAGYPAYVSSAAPNDWPYAVESWGYIRDAITKARVTSYNAWNMVLDPVGKGIDTSRDWAQNSLLVVNNGSIVQTPAYYVFRHVSQYVQPGASVVATSGSTDALGFKNPDGTIVAVVYSTTAKTNYIISMAGKKLQFSMPANGWATVVSM
jgi:glucosylceramidase